MTLSMSNTVVIISLIVSCIGLRMINQMQLKMIKALRTLHKTNKKRIEILEVDVESLKDQEIK